MKFEHKGFERSINTTTQNNTRKGSSLNQYLYPPLPKTSRNFIVFKVFTVISRATHIKF